jgi:hypothetical protein
MRSINEQERTSGRHLMALRREFVSYIDCDRDGGIAEAILHKS